MAGKTVFHGMGIEGARVRALADGRPREVVDSTRSGYHGSFLLHLPPGAYRLRAEAGVPGGAGNRTLEGQTGPVVVHPGVPRLDRVVVTLCEAYVWAPGEDRP